jgi:hypothetical protein
MPVYPTRSAPPGPKGGVLVNDWVRKGEQARLPGEARGATATEGKPMTEQAKEELLKLEEQMITLEKKKHEVGRRLEEIQGEIWLIRARLLLEVAWERDERGKPIYPNHESREEAVAARLEEHNRYQSLRRKEMTLSQEENDLLNELSRLSERKEQLLAER